MKVLITGGAGYIGSHTVVQMIESGFDPVIIDNFCNSNESVIDKIYNISGVRVPCFKADCNSINALENVFKEHKFDGVVHFAALKSVNESIDRPFDYYTNNINSLTNVLSCMKKYEVKKLVFSSSCTVYGTPDTTIVTEQSPIKEATNPYGHTKQICEDILIKSAKLDSSFKVAILRYFNPVGAHQSSLIGELPLGVPSNLVPYITQTAAGLRDQLSVFGNDYDTEDGTCVRDFIHVVDLAEAHISAFNWLENSDINCDMFNIGTGKGTTVQELIDTFIEVSQTELNYKISPRRQGDVPAIYANTSKATKALNWCAKKDVRQSMIDSWNWQKKISEL